MQAEIEEVILRPEINYSKGRVKIMDPTKRENIDIKTLYDKLMVVKPKERHSVIMKELFSNRLL